MDENIQIYLNKKRIIDHLNGLYDPILDIKSLKMKIIMNKMGLNNHLNIKMIFIYLYEEFHPLRQTLIISVGGQQRSRH